MKKIIEKYGLLSVAIVAVVAMIIAMMPKNNKIVFFDYNKIYNESDLKNKLEKDLKMVGGKRQSELDSLQMELSFMSKRIGDNKSNTEEVNNFEELKERFLLLQERYEEESVNLKENYFTQIRKDINDKAILYSEEKSYDFVFAAMGDGALMYGAKAKDITEDFKKYVNQK